jgi:exopolysaccharide/PEP-CTERM locus tyrosine autokinase
VGKIYDALKKAEEEAQRTKKKEPRPRTSIFSEPQKDYVKNQTEKTTLQDHLSIGKKKFSFLSKSKVKDSGASQKVFLDELFFINNPKSFIAEQYRIIRSHIFSLNKTKPLRTILITSALPGEGKTVTAFNLAVCIAQSINEHVLLVDADLRKPNLHTYFDLNLNGGLAQFLSYDEELSRLLFKTKIEKLTLLPAGEPPQNPSELLSTNKLTTLIQEVKSRYDDRFIIFDSSPMQQTVEPKLLAQEVDGIILVVASGLSNRSTVKRCVDTLGRDKILGVVFNKSKETDQTYNYHYYYSK